MAEFFGFGGYNRPAEGFLSWQHLLFVTALMAVMTTLAVALGKRNRDRSAEEKNKVLVWAALLIDGFELVKMLVLYFRSGDPETFLYHLPLFLCSIQLIALPVAAFSRGRLKAAALDFVMIFGLLGAVLGTYGAGQNYNAYPVLSIDNVVSGLTHTIAGFAALYIGIAKVAKPKKENIWITLLILLVFCVAAYTVNSLTSCNYMFLKQGDGTPYDILYNLVGGHPVVYPLSVIALFFVYIGVFYWVYFMLQRKKAVPV